MAKTAMTAAATTTTEAPPAQIMPERIFPPEFLPYVQHDRMPDGSEWCHLRVYFPPFFPLQYVGPFKSREQVNRWLKAVDPPIGHTLADMSNKIPTEAAETTTKPALALVNGRTKANAKGR